MNQNNYYKYGLAASLLLLVGLFIYNVNNNVELVDLKNNLAKTNEKLNETNKAATATSQHYQDSINQYLNREKVFTDAGTKLIALEGTAISPTSKVKVFWNQSNSKIVVVQDNLPKGANFVVKLPSVED